MSDQEVAASGAGRGRGYLLALTLTAVGVVYGDIGTSPLYAIRECFYGEYGVPVSEANILGVLSLIVWALILVISIKYLVFILRADNNGEGGIIALMSLIRPERQARFGTPRWLLVSMGIFGAALLYGDGMITPAISVLSAVEGLEVATPVFQPYIVPITVVILLGLFGFQRYGTAAVGRVFGPIMLVWFLVLAVLGAVSAAHDPTIFRAVNPIHGARFFATNGWTGFLVLGAVFLVVTGGEALYADMGHFGRGPIRLGWFTLVLPCLLLNYFGQGALLLRTPDAAHNPFYRLAPEWALFPLVGLATMATVIASQAVISGAFSLTRQAIQLGYLPRLGIEHTSEMEIGQVYMPAVNWLLAAATIGLVVGFGSSADLAAAYGVAVSTDMVFTTLIFFVAAREVFGWRMLPTSMLCGTLLLIDLAFFGANVLKIADGGWFPLLVAAIAFTLMSTWRRGREILHRRLTSASLPFEFLTHTLQADPPDRVPGTAIFMTGNPDVTPPALARQLGHIPVLHDRVILLTVETAEIPRVPPDERVVLEELPGRMYRMKVRFGFAEEPELPPLLEGFEVGDQPIVLDRTSFFLGREHLVATRRRGMALWREKLFALMSRNSQPATAYFHVPRDRVLELGTHVEL
ncbi:MAG: potassium transporter Kup [Longimicrobiales bacterium]